jgi:hypothetical protein
MFGWTNVGLDKCWIGQMLDWTNVGLVKCWVGQMLGQSNVGLDKCLSTALTKLKTVHKIENWRYK